MSLYREIDREVERWADKHALILNSSPWGGRESRCVWLSSKAGEVFQIWIEPPSNGAFRVHVGTIEGRRESDPFVVSSVSVDDARAALERAYSLVVKWMRPSTHYHPPRS